MKTPRFVSVFLLIFAPILYAAAQVSVEGISASGILDSKIPQITVLAPNGGEVYQVNDLVNITWNAIDSSFGATPIGIYYSIDNGVSYNSIAANLANSGSYAWTIPNSPSLQVLVKIAAVDSFGLQGDDVSDAVFKIDGPPLPPQNLALLLSDHAVNLTWDASLEGDVNRYVIYRSNNAGVAINSTNALDTVIAPLANYSDSAVVHGTTYYYVVTALDSMDNESIASGEVNGTAYILQVLAVSFKQRSDGSKFVDITYSFTGNPVGKYTISPFVRLSLTGEWIACENLSGAHGVDITPGTGKTIAWDFGTQMGAVYSSSAQIKIQAVEQTP